MCYLCLTGAPTTVQEFSRVHFQAMGEAVPVGDVAKEIDAVCPTKIGHDDVYRLMQHRSFIGVWRKTESEDVDITYELELAYRILRVQNSEVAARSLVVGWWRKHGMNRDEAKLNEVVSVAMETTQQYRHTFSNHPDGRKTDTTQQILNVLKGGVLSRLQIRQKLTELTGTQLQNALDRLRKANKIEKVGHGLYRAKESCIVHTQKATVCGIVETQDIFWHSCGNIGSQRMAAVMIGVSFGVGMWAFRNHSR